jgi:hypothetical protein
MKGFGSRISEKFYIRIIMLRLPYTALKCFFKYNFLNVQTVKVKKIKIIKNVVEDVYLIFFLQIIV